MQQMVRPNKTRDLIIRRADAADAAALVALMQLAHPDGDATDRDDFAAHAASIVLIAELDDQPAGYAVLSPVNDIAKAAHGYLVCDLFITAAAKARSAGKPLVAACAATAKQDGKTYLRWQTKAWDVAGQDFAQKLGAVEEPVMDHHLRQRRFDTLAGEGAAIMAAGAVPCV